MKLKKTVRSSSGPHQIKLSNAQGETTKDVFFNIQGKYNQKIIFFLLIVAHFHTIHDASLADVPSSPEDISVHDIFQDSCVLKWKKPKDDGGLPIAKYIVERQDLSVKGSYKKSMNIFSIDPFTYDECFTFVLLKQVDGTQLENYQLTNHCLLNARD